MTILENLRQERDALIGEIDGLMTGDFDPNDKTLVEARSKAEGLDSKIAALVDFQAKKDAASRIDSIAIRTKQDVDEKQTRATSSLTIGEAWTRSKAYADYSQTPKGNSMTVTLPFSAIQRRAPILTSTFAGLIQPDRIDPSEAPAGQTPLLDLIRTIRVNSNSVEWVYFPAGAPLGTVTAEGAVKTEAAITPSLKTVVLDTIASWAQYSRQFGEDASGLVDFLNASLSRGINDKREALAAETLLADASIPASAGGGTTLLENIRIAIGEVQSAGYRPQAVVLNPADYAGLDIDVLGKTLLGPQVGTQFWGVQPVAVGAVPVGTAYVGDFSVAMAELVRSEVSVYTTDSHASTFTSNVLTTLVEARTKPVVHRAEALVKVGGGVTTASASAGRK
jgi:HK97 family phage major capsid protein